MLTWRSVNCRILPRLSTASIGIKATTNEGMDDIGRGLAIAAHAVALIERS